ncbi:MAG: peptidylprolyl isomerase [Emcibacteraceae bacterium]|nr:peptidylprolyl isomerase [Emcibacteraceae bacterium]
MINSRIVQYLWQRTRRFASDPLVLFLALGGMVFAVFNYNAEPDKTLITLNAQTRQSLIDNQEILVGRTINADEITNLETDYITREILFNEAIERQLFLYDARAKEALIERFQFELLGSLPSNDQGDLIDYYSDNAALYMSEPEFSFQHIFFTDKPDNSDEILNDINNGQSIPGDQFWQGSVFPEYGASVIRSLFNQEFLSALEQADLNTWFGPLETNYGIHFVFLENKKEPKLISFVEIKNQVENDYLAAEQMKKLKIHLDRLKKKYDIQIEN